MWVPPCSDRKTGKYVNQISNPSYRSSPTLVEEILEWLMKPTMKTHSSILQEDVTLHNSNLKADLDFYYPLSSSHTNSLYHDWLDQFSSPASSPHSLYSQVVDLNCDQVQDNHIT